MMQRTWYSICLGWWDVLRTGSLWVGGVRIPFLLILFAALAVLAGIIITARKR